jgi:peptide methionine sulfoxide reductase MsrA
MAGRDQTRGSKQRDVTNESALSADSHQQYLAKNSKGDWLTHGSSQSQTISPAR